MSTVAIKWARTQYLGGPKSLKSILNAIAVRADNSGRTWVPQATLATDCSMTDRTVRHALAVLERLGVITREVRSRGRKGRLTDAIELVMSSTFRIAAEAVRAAAASLKSITTTTARALAKGRPASVNLRRVPTGNPLPGNTQIGLSNRESTSGGRKEGKDRGKIHPHAGTRDGTGWVRRLLIATAACFSVVAS